MFSVVFLLLLGSCMCSPLPKAFKEAEYDIPIEKFAGQKSYFVKTEEMPVYEQQFAKIRELGEEINCKITGNCAGSKRGLISKKSMFDDSMPGAGEAQFQDQMAMNAESMGGGGSPMGGGGSPMGGGGNPMGGEDVNAMMGGGGANPAASAFSQKDAASFGQQPQLDIKLSDQEKAATGAGMGGFSNPMGGAGGPGGLGGLGGLGGAGAAPPDSPEMHGGNDELLKLREQQNAQTIDMAIQDKMAFMDKANGPPQMPQMGGAPKMPGAPKAQQAPGVVDPLSQLSPPQSDTKDGMPGGVSENDLLKAEDIQPNEMKGISSFLKDSNHVDKPVSTEATFNDSPSEDGMPGKTNIDFGGSNAASIDNEGGDANSDGGPLGPGPEPSNASPVFPGGPEVPTLNNVGLGMSGADLGPPGMPPSFKFVQDNTRQMIQQNSDYKVPQSAFTGLWNSYMQSTQSLLGEKDPSANSRQSIWRPAEKKIHRRSNVERIKKASITPTKDTKSKSTTTNNLVYVPTFVIKNVLQQVKKTLKTLPKQSKGAKRNSKASKIPPVYITEKQGKRYLVINPENPALVQGFANVDDHFTGFQLPLTKGYINGAPASLPSFGTRGVFPASMQGPLSTMTLSGMPILNGQTTGGVFHGYMAVPVVSREPLGPSSFASPQISYSLPTAYASRTPFPGNGPEYFHDESPLPYHGESQLPYHGESPLPYHGDGYLHNGPPDTGRDDLGALNHPIIHQESNFGTPVPPSFHHYDYNHISPGEGYRPSPILYGEPFHHNPLGNIEDGFNSMHSKGYGADYHPGFHEHHPSVYDDSTHFPDVSRLGNRFGDTTSYYGDSYHHPNPPSNIPDNFNVMMSKGYGSDYHSGFHHDSAYHGSAFPDTSKLSNPLGDPTNYYGDSRHKANSPSNIAGNFDAMLNKGYGSDFHPEFHHETHPSFDSDPSFDHDSAYFPDTSKLQNPLGNPTNYYGDSAHHGNPQSDIADSFNAMMSKGYSESHREPSVRGSHSSYSDEDSFKDRPTTSIEGAPDFGTPISNPANYYGDDTSRSSTADNFNAMFNKGYGGDHTDERESRMGESPNNFSKMFNGDFGRQTNFDKSKVERPSNPPHPYVFTKEHVGFGPITVEAHTASYKGNDPKDDDN